MASPFAPLFWAESSGHRQMSTNAEIRRKWDKRGIRKHLRSRVAECIVAGITNEAIAKIDKPTPTPLKHGGNGVSGGMKIARDRAESHVSAVIGKATPTTEARRIAKIEKPTPTPLKHGGNGVSEG